MNPDSAASAYRQEAFESAPPIKIVRMLYQGALRFLDRAVACEPADPTSDFVDWLSRADAVVTELRVALRSEAAPEVCANLERLYLFVEERIGAALSERSVEPARQAREVLATLLAAWTAVEVEVKAAG
jgi:flagellar protein FliS